MLVSAFTIHAAEYDIIQLSTDDTSGREPVISETGLSAWGAYVTTAAGKTTADIMIHTNGTTRPLLATHIRDHTANIRPFVHSNTVVWVGVGPGTAIDASWLLRQVPESERDTPVPELTAMPSLRIAEEGRQVWADSAPATNDLPNHMDAVAVTNDVETAAPESSVTATTETQEAEAANDEPAAEPGIIKPPPDTSVLDDLPRRLTSGDTEIMLWRGGTNIYQLTRDNRDNLGPTAWGDMVAWQTAKGWPFGWEIMVWADGQILQLTTNYYYDLAPKVHGSQVVWHGWDGHDFEIFLYDHAKGVTVQITSNQYDDVSPSIWDGVIVWEGYAGANADIFMWKDGQIRKISKNIEDDLNPRIWKGQVVWQGFDGDDFEIYWYDGEEVKKLTSNTYDDVNPDIRDGVICWMGYYDNWDSEIFVWDGGPNAIRLTDNEHDDRNPRTAGGRIVWESEKDGKSMIFLAEPRK